MARWLFVGVCVLFITVKMTDGITEAPKTAGGVSDAIAADAIKMANGDMDDVINMAGGEVDDAVKKSAGGMDDAIKSSVWDMDDAIKMSGSDMDEAIKKAGDDMDDAIGKTAGGKDIMKRHHHHNRRAVSHFETGGVAVGGKTVKDGDAPKTVDRVTDDKTAHAPKPAAGLADAPKTSHVIAQQIADTTLKMIGNVTGSKKKPFGSIWDVIRMLKTSRDSMASFVSVNGSVVCNRPKTGDNEAMEFNFIGWDWKKGEQVHYKSRSVMANRESDRLLQKNGKKNPPMNFGYELAFKEGRIVNPQIKIQVNCSDASFSWKSPVYSCPKVTNLKEGHKNGSYVWHVFAVALPPTPAKYDAYVRGKIKMICD